MKKFLLLWILLAGFLYAQDQEVPTLRYAELRLPYREVQDQIVPPTPSGALKAVTSEEKRLLNLLYATITTFSRYVGRGDNVPQSSLCDVSIKTDAEDSNKLFIHLEIRPDVYWRLPKSDPNNKIIHQDLLYTIDYLRKAGEKNRERALGTFFSNNIEIHTEGAEKNILRIRMNSEKKGDQFPKRDEWTTRSFFSTFHVIPTPRLKNPQGGGPFVFTNFNRARKEIILERNPLSFHWAEPNSLAPQKIVIKELSDRLQKLIAGEVDLVAEVGAMDLFRTDLQTQFQILYSPASSFYYIGFNKNKATQDMDELLKKEELQAITNLNWFTILKRAYEGVDQATKYAIRDNNFNKDAEVLEGPFDSSSPVELYDTFENEEAEFERTAEIEEQQKHVARDCMKNEEGNEGLMAHPILRNHFAQKKWTILYQDFSKFSTELKDIADGLAVRLQLLGILPNQIEVHGVRSLSQWNYRMTNQLFDFVVSYFDYGQDYDIADFIYPRASENYVGYHSIDVEKNYDEFHKTQDPGHRVQCLTEIQKILRDEYPGVFIVSPTKFTVYNQDRIQKLYTDDNFLFSNMEDWQLSEK